MSLRAMLWALNDAPVDDAQTVLVLIALADNANEDGTGAWPAVSTVATRARCSPRTVQRHLQSLKDAHLIREGNQALVAGYRADRRPVVYDLNLARIRPQIVERPRGDNLTPRDERGDTGGSHGVTPVTERGDTGVTQTVLEPNLEPKDQNPLVTAAPQPLVLVAVEDGFDAWWEAYPRKVAKDAARKAYRRAIRNVPQSVLMDGVLRYRDDPNRVPQFTAHPATWLNGGRWDDAALPARTAASGTTAEERSPTGREHWAGGGRFE